MARRAVQKRSYRNEIIMFTSDSQMGGWAYHWVHQMRRMGYEHWLILADKEPTCATLQAGWEPMVRNHAELPLSCAWSSYPRAHPGWAQWAPQRGADSMHNVYILWTTRWWVAWQLLSHGTNVLSLDVDAVLLTDIYELLRAPPLSQQDVLITRNSDNSQSLNCGFVYFNRRPDGRQGASDATGATGERSALAKCGPASLERAARASAAGGGVPAAEWVARAMWERTQLFLEIERDSLREPPLREVLWEQDAWNDLAKSLELNARVFPWAVGYGKQSDLWAKLGYRRHVDGGKRGIEHREKWVDWRKIGPKRHSLPPWPAASEPHARSFYEADLRTPLLWIQLCPPANASSSANAPAPPGTTRGIPLGLVSSVPTLPGRLMIAPTFLASLGDDPQPDWAGATPPAFSYLHLTNMWHCFPHMCWSKAGRLFWLRAHGFWDERLDALGITPRGKPYDGRTRVLTLPAETYAAIEALTPPHGGDPPDTSAERWLGFRRAHALVHNLVTLASLLGRKPHIPEVPCSFIRGIQPRKRSNPSARSRFGVSHPSTVVTGSVEREVCHLAPGTWRPGGPDQCYHNRIMHSFDFRRFLASPAVAAAARAGHGNGSLTVPRPPLPPDERSSLDAKLDVAALRAICERASQLAETPVLVLDGLLPARDFLIDAPLDAAEFASERRRKATRRPRWHSLLQPSTLRALEGACPGAKDLIADRKACVGYFLAE